MSRDDPVTAQEVVSRLKYIRNGDAELSSEHAEWLLQLIQEAYAADRALLRIAELGEGGAGRIDASSVAAIAREVLADRPSGDEMVCDRCGRRHDTIWSAPSDLWNKVMRGGVQGAQDEFEFCCPICFMQLAKERVGLTGWTVAPAADRLPGCTGNPYFCPRDDLGDCECEPVHRAETVLAVRAEWERDGVLCHICGGPSFAWLTDDATWAQTEHLLGQNQVCMVCFAAARIAAGLDDGNPLRVACRECLCATAIVVEADRPAMYEALESPE